LACDRIRGRLSLGVFVNRKMMLCGLTAASLMLPACATITRGTSQKFNIETTPTAAEVSLSTGQQCVSPCKLKLKRKPGFTATVKKEGYQTQTLTIDSKLGGGGAVAGAGNILIGGVIGGIVDGTNGSMNNLTPNPLKVTLVPVAAEAESVATTAAPAAVESVAVPAAEAAPAADAAPATDAAPIANAPAAEAAPTDGE
jgi:hypothetical protein